MAVGIYSILHKIRVYDAIHRHIIENGSNKNERKRANERHEEAVAILNREAKKIFLSDSKRTFSFGNSKRISRGLTRVTRIFSLNCIKIHISLLLTLALVLNERL